MYSVQAHQYENSYIRPVRLFLYWITRNVNCGNRNRFVVELTNFQTKKRTKTFTCNWYGARYGVVQWCRHWWRDRHPTVRATHVCLCNLSFGVSNIIIIQFSVKLNANHFACAHWIELFWICCWCCCLHARNPMCVRLIKSKLSDKWPLIRRNSIGFDFLWRFSRIALPLSTGECIRLKNYFETMACHAPTKILSIFFSLPISNYCHFVNQLYHSRRWVGRVYANVDTLRQAAAGRFDSDELKIKLFRVVFCVAVP